jgi:pimeloyl-ACP methyl ester carboxylesterase
MILITQQLSKPFGKVTYRQAGAPASRRDTSKEVLLLVHGVGMQSVAWLPQIKALSLQYHVIAVDMPGHGGSDCIASDAELTDYVTWLKAFIDSLKLGAVNIAGHSMGALITAGFAVTYPLQTQRVALLNGVFRRDAKARALVEARAAEVRAGKFDIETPLKRWFGDTAADITARGVVASLLHEINMAGYATAYSAFAHGDSTFADRWSNIAAPLLALTGSDDPNSTVEMSKAMAVECQDGEAVVLVGHRHMVNLTAIQAVNDTLLQWLKRPVDRGVVDEQA